MDISTEGLLMAFCSMLWDGEGLLHEAEAKYSGKAASVLEDDEEAVLLIEVVRNTLVLLQQKGIGKEELLRALASPSGVFRRRQDKEGECRLLITKDCRIFLKRGTSTEEIVMRPMPKALFLLFLKHPEGIEFKRMCEYKQQLSALYRCVTKFTDEKKICSCIEKITFPLSNDLNVNIKRISKSLAEYLSDELLESYDISGKRGEARRIRLDRRLVEWL